MDELEVLRGDFIQWINQQKQQPESKNVLRNPLLGMRRTNLFQRDVKVDKVPRFWLCTEQYTNNMMITGTASGKLWTTGAPLTSISQTFGWIMQHIKLSYLHFYTFQMLLCHIKHVNIKDLLVWLWYGSFPDIWSTSGEVF